MDSYSYTIVSDVCEGAGDCVPICPVEAIHWAEGQINIKGTKFTYIDDQTCIGCGACLTVCPIEGAILDVWRPELQRAKR
jgi:NAD-dependent dihydropyrimidine dehydrogenase PreA subunit